VLAARLPVVYALDLAVAPAVAAPVERRALVVADPRGDLPGAAAEAVAVRRVLQSGPQPWRTDELAEGAASADEVRRRLVTTELFHYAGHGSFAGLGGWDSSLLLAKDTRLTLGDLLALDRLPRWVVLSGCDTGRSTAEAPVAGLGLAHAFLLAGSRAVIASTRPTDDRTLPAFFAELYRQWQREPDLAAALQRAQLAWRQRTPTADWASFRLFEP
jgi:CHAT domain-containing protein